MVVEEKPFNYLLFTGIILVFLFSWILSCNKTHQDLDPQLLAKDSIIQDLTEQIEVLEDEVDLREEEISYLGHKLDSIKSK